MARNGWEHYELEKEMSNSNIAQLLELFKRETKKYSDKCVEFIDLQGNLSDAGKKRVEEECNHLDEARVKVSLRIAEIMTDIKLK